jgi:thiamine biosynthesis lipoprotein
MINLGGDLIASGTKPSGKPWLIGIRDPRDDQGLSARLTVSNTALFTSGDYERFFIENGRRYHHIFNPKTGLPGTCNRSATAVGTDILAVDAAVKTAFLIPAPQALSYLHSRGMRGLLIDSAGVAWASTGLKDILSVDSGFTVQYR